MKRIIVGLSALTLLMSMAMAGAHAEVSPEGALRAGFHTALSGGNGTAYATLGHDAQASSFAAPGAIRDPGGGTLDAGARRITPGLYDQEYCSSNVFGVWWFLYEAPEYKEYVEGVTVDIAMNGEPLAVEYSQTKMISDPAGFFGGAGWWKSAGVPVLGHLDAGVYLFESVITWPGYDPWPLAATITIIDC